MNTAIPPLQRREFLKQTAQVAALALGATNPRTWLATAESIPTARIQVGILLGMFGRGTLETRLDAVKASGLDCVQVSLDCAGLPDMPDEIPPKVADRQAKDHAWRFYRAVALTNAAGF